MFKKNCKIMFNKKNYKIIFNKNCYAVKFIEHNSTHRPLGI